MKIEVKNFTTHLGSHDFGIENMDSRGHKLAKPSEGIDGFNLPFITFYAVDQNGAEDFCKRLNWLAAKYKIDSLDLANVVYTVDRLFGR